MRVVVDILRTPDEGEWRAWTALDRACRSGWPEEYRGNEVMEELASVLESRVSSLAGRWELCGVVTQVAESRFLRSLAPRFLRILGGMPEGTVSGRYSVSLSPSSLGKASATLAYIAPAFEMPVLLGYLRWVAACSSSYGPKAGGGGIETTPMNIEVLAELVRSTKELDSRGGDIVLRAVGDWISITCVLC